MSAFLKNKNLRKVIEGDSSWNIFADENDKLWAIPKPDSCKSTQSSTFGDKKHILKLMREGNNIGVFTEAGLELMSGLTTVFLPKGHFLTFR